MSSRNRFSKQSRNSSDSDIGWITSINNNIKCEKLNLEESSGVLYKNNAELSERINRLEAEYDQYAPSYNQYDDNNNMFDSSYFIDQSSLQSIHKASPRKYSDISNRPVASHNRQQYNHQEHIYSVPHKSRSYHNNYDNNDIKSRESRSNRETNGFQNLYQSESDNVCLTQNGYKQYPQSTNDIEQCQINTNSNKTIENDSNMKTESPLYTDIFDNNIQAENHLKQNKRPESQNTNHLNEWSKLHHNDYNNHDTSGNSLNNRKSSTFEDSIKNNSFHGNQRHQDTVSLHTLEEILSRKLEPLKSGLTSTDKTNDEYPYSQMSYEKIQFLDSQQKVMKDILKEHSHLLHEINSKDKPALQIFKEITNKLDEQEKYAKEDKNQLKTPKEDNGELRSFNQYLNSKLGDHDEKLTKIDDQLHLILLQLQNKQKENQSREAAQIQNRDIVDNYEKKLEMNPSKRSLSKSVSDGLDVNISENFIIPTKNSKTESTKPTSGFNSNTEGLLSSRNEYDNGVEEKMETKLVKLPEQSLYNGVNKGSTTNNQLLYPGNATTTSNTDSLLSLTVSDNGPPDSLNSLSLSPIDKINISNDSNQKPQTLTNSNETSKDMKHQNPSDSTVKHFSSSTSTLDAKPKSKLPVKEAFNNNNKQNNNKINNKSSSKELNNNSRNASISTQANQLSQSLPFSNNQDDIQVNKSQTTSKIPKRSKSAERIVRMDKQKSLNNSSSWLNDLESSYETLYDPVTTPRNPQDENICF